MSDPVNQIASNGRPATLVSDSRRDAVDRARQNWIHKLIDLSRRNNLLYYRALKTGTLDLAAANPSHMAALLSGSEPVSLALLLPRGKDEPIGSLVREIMRRAVANAEEKGLQTLHVALGLATWTPADGGRPADAPVLLLPVSLESKGSQSFTINRIGAVQLNLVLAHVLETELGVDVAGEELISHLLSDDEGEAFDPTGLYAELRKRASDVPGFDIKPSAILGNFAFQKMAMVRDLRERFGELAAHDIVAAIAGDIEARALAGSQTKEQDPRELDRIPPDNEFVVLDADSSQQCAIANILMGQNAVIHGPPGTGKSQTIANLIATLAANGNRILFVAEKRAALEVVLRRLTENGLGHLAIDLHGADVSPRKTMQQVADALGKVRDAVPVACDHVHSQLIERRTRLNDHVGRIHTKREPTGFSVYEMQGKLLRLGIPAVTALRWRGDELRKLKQESAGRVRDLLMEAAGFEGLFLRTDSSPWTGSRLENGTDVERVLDLAQRASSVTFPAFAGSLAEVVQQAGLRWPGTMQEAKDLMGLVEGVQSKLRTYSPDIYRQNCASLLADLAAGRNGGLAGAWAWLTKPSYRRARNTLLGLRAGKAAPSPVLYSDLVEIERQASHWKSLGQNGSVPKAVSQFGTHQQNTGALFADVLELGAALPAKDLCASSVEDLRGLLDSLAADPSTPRQIPKLFQIEARLASEGAGRLVDEIRARRPASGLWPMMFQYAWMASTLDATCLKDAEVRGFKGLIHNRYVNDFVHLDEERITLAAERVRRSHGLRAIAAMNERPEQQHLIRAEASKTRRHLPLRKVFAQAADVLTAVCPCWMASPLSVSQLLDGGNQYFDFVIFDEASQVLPEDAIPAILRGKRVVVAGDNKQLPPTTFFAASEEEEYSSDDDAGAAEGFESLLDMMIPFVKSCYLDWHYRSRDESLINFSNHYLYQNRLITFPGPGGPPAIRHELVQQETGIDGQEESSSNEVGKVVELVLRSAREHPHETLGVITMGIKHMNRVQAALDREVEKFPELESFFNPGNHERFFVKNLERVQGDERDSIIISVGYCKDRGGNLPLRFGPLLAEGGRRRLNVAITRARQGLTVVSSFSHLDIDLARVRAGTGVELLRNYLQYAASEGKNFGDAHLTSMPLNDFEAEIFDALTVQGLKLIPQLGASQFRIDMVAEHPDKPGRLVLAIECDGASYHSSYTARDRDRLRQQQLESLGWRFHRIWSADWFLRRDDEVKRAMEAFRAAIKYADLLDAGGARDEPPPVSVPRESRMGEDNTSSPRKRGPRPAVPLRPSIAQYRNQEISQLIDWLLSDGRLRTDEEIVDEMVSILGFSRRGGRIERVLRSALETSRLKSR